MKTGSESLFRGTRCPFFERLGGKGTLTPFSLLLAVVAPLSLHAADHIFSDSFERAISKVAQPDIELALADDSVWAGLKSRCDTDLNSVIADIYAGFDWRQAAQRIDVMVGGRQADGQLGHFVRHIAFGFQFDRRVLECEFRHANP